MLPPIFKHFTNLYVAGQDKVPQTCRRTPLNIYQPKKNMWKVKIMDPQKRIPRYSVLASYRPPQIGISRKPRNFYRKVSPKKSRKFPGGQFLRGLVGLPGLPNFLPSLKDLAKFSRFFFWLKEPRFFSPPFFCFWKDIGEDIFVEAELSFLETHFEDLLH